MTHHPCPDPNPTDLVPFVLALNILPLQNFDALYTYFVFVSPTFIILDTALVLVSSDFLDQRSLMEVFSSHLWLVAAMLDCTTLVPKKWLLLSGHL